MDAKKIIYQYYQAWIDNQRQNAYQLLDESLHFKSPHDEFFSASEFMNKCWQYSPSFTEFNVVSETYSGDSAHIAYNMNGTIITEKITLNQNKISEIIVDYPH